MHHLSHESQGCHDPGVPEGSAPPSTLEKRVRNQPQHADDSRQEHPRIKDGKDKKDADEDAKKEDDKKEDKKDDDKEDSKKEDNKEALKGLEEKLDKLHDDVKDLDGEHKDLASKLAARKARRDALLEKAAAYDDVYEAERSGGGPDLGLHRSTAGGVHPAPATAGAAAGPA